MIIHSVPLSSTMCFSIGTLKKHVTLGAGSCAWAAPEMKLKSSSNASRSDAQIAVASIEFNR